MQLRLHLHIKSLRGHVYAWVPPPPGDRLWFSFVEPPELQAVATPMVPHRTQASPPMQLPACLRLASAAPALPDAVRL